MATTPNYGFLLPTDGDQQDVSVLDSNFNAIDSTIAAQAQGIWTAFTPTLSNFTLGNGSIVGMKMRKHNEETLKILLTFGTTTAFTGVVALTLPDPCSADAIVMGEAMFRDASAGGYIAGKAFSLSQGPTSLSLFSAILSGANANLSALSATNPFTWATTDQMMLSITYKID